MIRSLKKEKRIKQNEEREEEKEKKKERKEKGREVYYLYNERRSGAGSIKVVSYSVSA